MERFVQLHLLTSYPPANLNRDDLGRPKTAVMGSAPRLRISSQSLKRAWRESDLFKQALDGHIGTRTKSMGIRIFEKMLAKGIPQKKAMAWAGSVAGVFGKPKELTKKEKQELAKLEEEERNKKELTGLEIEQLAHFSPEEEQAIDELIDKLDPEGKGPSDEDLDLLRAEHQAADIALFGRMLAAKTSFNVEAAAQVAHAITVHRVAVEDDFFTAVDDLNEGKEDLGAGHMGETEFAAGLFYLYLCIDRELLQENLSEDGELAKKTLGALIEAAATVAPKGKQNTFGSRAYASYVLCERGDSQPRSLSVAFLKPVTGFDMMTEAVERIQECRANMNKVYDLNGPDPCVLNAQTGEGNLKEIIEYAIKGME